MVLVGIINGSVQLLWLQCGLPSFWLKFDGITISIQYQADKR